MGQRSQTFIKVMNPVHYLLKESKKPKLLEKQLADWIEALGTDKYTVLAYHHQWLYGLTFASIMHKVLAFYQGNIKHYATHPINLEYFLQYAPRSLPSASIQFFVDFHTMLMSIHNAPWNYTREAAFEYFHFLNLTEPEMRTAFDRGDNNDGVCIVDAIEKKYAFLTISGGGCGEVIVPPYHPMTAEQYVGAYYPLVDKDRCEGAEPLTKKKIIENKRRVVMTLRAFAPFELLTPTELNAMFPDISTPVS